MDYNSDNNLFESTDLKHNVYDKNNPPSEFEKLYGNQFFVIDSNNINLINNQLYGFILIENEVIQDVNLVNSEKITGEGTYIYFDVSEDSISIYQDFNGSYGLYLYKNEDYFAISNSFLKLVEHLKDSFNLTLNWNYAHALISSGLCSYIYEETLINEILSIPRNYIIHIDKLKKTVNYEIIDYGEHSVKLNSKEGLDILDKWFYKWVNILRSIKKKTNNIIIDLSGGFDSRMTFILALCSNIDLNKVKVNSIDNKTHTHHQEDFLIASEIADEFNFELNKEVFAEPRTFFKDMSTTLNLSFYLKLGFHNQMNFNFYKRDEPVYVFNGAAGESIRGYNTKTPVEFRSYFKNEVNKFDSSLWMSSKEILDLSINRLKDVFEIDDDNSKDLIDLLYTESRFRNHFGKLSVERFLANQINFSPLLDPNLHKLDFKNSGGDDDDLLLALIFCRYCPKLLKFRFQGNRTINQSTINYAKIINNIKPFESEVLEFISGPYIDYEKINLNKKLYKYNFGTADVNNYLKEIFNSKLFESEFKKYFSNKLYSNISKSIENRKYFSLQDAYPIFSILKTIDCIVTKQDKNYYNFSDWLNEFNWKNGSDDRLPQEIFEILLNYVTARVDLINVGDNDIQIYDISDKFSSCYSPGWFKINNSNGWIVTSNALKLKFKVKIMGDGELRLWLRSVDVRDKNNKRFPIYIDYTKLIINEKSLLSENKLISHDNFGLFKFDVKNGDIIDVYIEWKPFNSQSLYES